MLKRNVSANVLGGACVAVLTLVITPLQVNLLGVEAFGVVSFIATLQVVVGVLDFGFSSTITREIAADTSPGRRATQPLLRTAVTVYWSLALVVGVLLLEACGFLARYWFNAANLNVATLVYALQAAILFLVLRWPVALYTGVLAGAQRMELLNFVKVCAVTLRLVGGILVLLVWTDLTIFLLWTGIASVVEVVAYAIASRRAVPEMNWRPGFSIASIRGIWGFYLQMAALATLSIILTQVDRLMISKFLPLEQLGFYSLAYTAATAISLVISSLSTALMPSFAADHGAGERARLLARYDAATGAMLYATGFVLFSLVFFGRPILGLWVSAGAAENSWLPLTMLAAGFWLGASVSNAYTVSVAMQRPRGILLLSAITGLGYLPLMYFAVVNYGIVGAAAAWLVLQISYVLMIIPWVHRKVLHLPVMAWFTQRFFPFLFTGCAAFGAGRLLTFWPPMNGDWGWLAALLLSLSLYGVVGYQLIGRELKDSIRLTVRRSFAAL
jgi:O-antigen/teichoic acid export membrane protein